MKIGATSDTHGQTGWEIPPCDVFIHAGDITAGGSLKETAEFAARLRAAMQRPDGPKAAVIVPGNHDACFAIYAAKTRALFDSNVHLLLGDPVTIDGILFYGSPWTPRFMHWHFMMTEEELVTHYKNMPAAVDVLVTHGPPWGVLDPGWKTPHAGSKALYDAIRTRQVGTHVFGHLHSAGGRELHSGRTTFYNVAACDESYRLRHPSTREIQISPVK